MNVPVSLLIFGVVIGIVFSALGIYLQVPQIVVYGGSAALTALIILKGRATWARLFNR
jgi:hypothetical protein